MAVSVSVGSTKSRVVCHGFVDQRIRPVRQVPTHFMWNC